MEKKNNLLASTIQPKEQGEEEEIIEKMLSFVNEN